MDIISDKTIGSGIYKTH